jgi:thioesterase domain-containing protein
LIRTRNVDVREAVSHVRFLARLAGKNAVRLERNPVQVTSASEIDTQAAGAAANEAAAKVYIPAPFSGKLVVFLAGDEEHSTRVLDDSRLGWRDFAMGGFDVRRAQGMHNSMFCEPHVGEIARQLEALMQPIQAAAGDACG